MPDFFDLVWSDARDFCQGCFSEACRGTDPQRACDELEDSVAGRWVRDIQPLSDEIGQCGFGGFFQGFDEFAQARCRSIGTLGVVLPDEGNGFGKVAHIIVGPFEEFGIDALHGKRAEHGGFGGGKRECACHRRQGIAAVRVGGHAEIVFEESDFSVAGRGECQAFEKCGEGNHETVSAWVSAGVSSSSSPYPTSRRARPLMPRWARAWIRASSRPCVTQISAAPVSSQVWSNSSQSE